MIMYFNNSTFLVLLVCKLFRHYFWKIIKLVVSTKCLAEYNLHSVDIRIF
uniref:Uncharacterized protein n=1 Tax=Arundo donax TaxID=35708 RepID=A0A0A8YZA1_ARUDO